MYLPKTVSYFIPLLFFSLCQSQVHGQTLLIQKERQQLPFLKDSLQLVMALKRIGMLYTMKDPDSCFYYGIKAKAMARRLHYAKGEACADNVIASALYLRGLFRESLDLYSKVVSEQRQLSDTANVTMALMNLSSVYLALSDSTHAKEFSHQAMRTGMLLKKDSVMSMVYANYCAINKQLADSTRMYLEKARAIATRYKDQRTMIFIDQVAARQLLDRGRNTDALPLITRSLTASRHAGLEYLEVNSLGLYAACYENQTDTVLKYYNLAYQLFRQKGYHYKTINILDVILTYTQKTGDKDKINRVHELLEAELIKENSNLKKFIADYLKFNIIQNDNRLLTDSNKDNRKKIWLLVAACCSATVLIIFISRLYRNSSRLAIQVGKQNRQMQMTLNALEQSQQDNTRMMKIAAHDLRSPISGITSLAALMLEEPGRTEEDRVMLELIRTSGQNSLELVSELLQLHTDAEEMKKEPVELSQLLQYCVELLRFQAENKGQQIKLTAEPVTVNVNREKIWRVISNLIANAIKFSNHSGQISVKLEKSRGTVVITVADQGIGIPAEMQNKVFDMFTEARRPGTAGEQPFGMGLSIAKQIVEAR